MGTLRIAIWSTVAVWAGCSNIQPLQQGEPPRLGKGEGLAAVMMDTADPLSEVFIRPAGGNGTALEIPSIPVGQNVYLFKAPAGNYCFQQFHYGDILFFGRGADLDCFNVPAGELGYSGDLAPRVVNGQVIIHQNYDFDAFQRLLKKQYPQIAAQFLRPAPPPAPGMPAPAQPARCEATQQVCAWTQTVAGSRSQTIFLENNTLWPIRIRVFQLYDCRNLRQACTTKRVNIRLRPHASAKVLTVDPANPLGAYAYQFRYEYGFDLPGGT